MSTRSSAGRVRETYEFIKAHRTTFSVQTLCRVLDVAPSGYYAWLQQPLSNRALEDARLLRLIRASFVESQGIYGAPRVFLDLREAGETCSKHRVERLMRENRLRALHGYRTRRWSVGKPAVLIPNLLRRRFTVTRPNRAWVTDITYIRTWQGWLYLAVVMDLFSRRIVGWSARPTIHRELVLDAVLMAVRRRRPLRTLIHSDQGTQYGSDAWRRFCRSHRLEPSMSRKGNCWDNAVAESFFSSLKKERIKKHIYKTRDLALADVADYIDRFYDRSRRHSHLGGVSPEQFEAAHVNLPSENSSSLNERIPRRIAVEGTCDAAGSPKSKSSES
jgi:putative transposase